MGCNPILKRLAWCIKNVILRRRSVDAALMLTLSVNGSEVLLPPPRGRHGMFIPLTQASSYPLIFISQNWRTFICPNIGVLSISWPLCTHFSDLYALIFSGMFALTFITLMRFHFRGFWEPQMNSRYSAEIGERIQLIAKSAVSCYTEYCPFNYPLYFSQ